MGSQNSVEQKARELRTELCDGRNPVERGGLSGVRLWDGEVPQTSVQCADGGRIMRVIASAERTYLGATVGMAIAAKTREET